MALALAQRLLTPRLSDSVSSVSAKRMLKKSLYPIFRSGIAEYMQASADTGLMFMTIG